jgi:hypothetical protein
VLKRLNYLPHPDNPDLFLPESKPRDFGADPDGRTLYYYHQSAVVVESADGERLRLDSHGYQTSTTKERINRHTPGGYHVVQRDYAWYLKTPDGERVEFIDGMVIEP